MPPRAARPEAIVAGHICLDIIPAFRGDGGFADVLVPGKLVDMGPALLSTGGAVSNTGLCLHQLGTRTRLMGKVGADGFGDLILSRLRRAGAGLAEGMLVAPGEQSSYTVVLSRPGADRIFLHCPGSNDTFGAADLEPRKLAGARLLHFGYPPLMRRMYQDGGRECAALFTRAKKAGLATSLDLAKPDPASPAGRCDWSAFLRRVLPAVDLFLPSIDEILQMIDPRRSAALLKKHGAEGLQAGLDADLLRETAGTLLDWGAAVVVMKLGDQGLYLRTCADPRRLRALGRGVPAKPETWVDREVFSPCFRAKLVGTTGSGDATIAGFLSAFLRDEGPEHCAVAATAVGACSVEAADATGGVPSWSRVAARLRKGWPRLPFRIRLPGWRQDRKAGVWTPS